MLYPLQGINLIAAGAGHYKCVYFPLPDGLERFLGFVETLTKLCDSARSSSLVLSFFLAMIQH